MSENPKKPSKPISEPAKEPSEERDSFQFGDSAGNEPSFIRRAINVGLRYTKGSSEHSAMRVLPVLEIETSEAEERFNPKIADEHQAPAPIPNPAANSAPIPAVRAGTPKKPPAAPQKPQNKMAFGPPEKTLFKSALNEFAQEEQAKKVQQAQRRMQAPRIHQHVATDTGSALEASLKQAIALLFVGAMSFAIYKLFTAKTMETFAEKVKKAKVESQPNVNDDYDYSTARRLNKMLDRSPEKNQKP